MQPFRWVAVINTGLNSATEILIVTRIFNKRFHEINTQTLLAYFIRRHIQFSKMSFYLKFGMMVTGCSAARKA